MKQQLAKLLNEQGHEVVDFGNKSYDNNDDYPDFAIPLARAVSRGELDRGILVCGSGVGASVAANKIVGVRPHSATIISQHARASRTIT